VNLNLKQYEKAIEDCNYVADHTFDFQKKSKAFGKIGYAYLEQNILDKAIEYFEKSLLENTDVNIKTVLRETQNRKKKEEAEKYINPEIAEEHNNKANEHYKAGRFPEALKEYNETINRDPSNPKYYSNRAAVYVKLLALNDAVKDCDKALEMDPNFLRAYNRKATCHFHLKELHKAMETYEKALRLFPGDQELKEGYSKVMSQINSSGTPQEDEDRAKRAQGDPEIQRLLVDPRIQQFFKDLKENPKSANDAMMKDEFIAAAFKTLVAAGIIKTK